VDQAPNALQSSMTTSLSHSCSQGVGSGCERGRSCPSTRDQGSRTSVRCATHRWGGRNTRRKSLSPATVRRAQAITFRRVCIEEFDDGLEADAVLGESDFPVDAPEERVDFVENDCRDLIECVCRDGVRMGDVELREIVEQVSFPEVVLVRVVDESTEEVIAR